MAVSVYANEGGDASAGKPVQRLDGFQFIDRGEVVVSPAVGEDGVDLCVGEEGEFPEVALGGRVQVNGVFGPVREVCIERFELFLVEFFASIFSYFPQLLHPVVGEDAILCHEHAGRHNEQKQEEKVAAHVLVYKW